MLIRFLFTLGHNSPRECKFIYSNNFIVKTDC